MNKLRFLILPLVFLFLIGCSDGDSPASSSDESLSFESSDGQQLLLERAPTRIVSLAPHATEIICALGAGDRLVAVDKYANCPAGSKAKPELDSFQPNLEAIASYRPDLVYVFSDQGGIVEALRRVGVPVLHIKSPETLEGVFEHVETFGRLTDREAEAGNMITSMRSQLASVKASIASVSKGPRFYHELSEGYYSVAPNTFIGDLYTQVKGENIAAGASTAYPQLSAEVIVSRDPEVVVVAYETKPADVKGRPGWSNVSAVKNDRICIVDADLVSRAGPRVIEGVQALAKCLYPGR